MSSPDSSDTRFDRLLPEHIVQASRDKNWQKICDGNDWFDPHFQWVLNHVLKKAPSLHRKQWEFVVIALLLIRAGKLGRGSRGASFGAGNETLLYALTPYIEHLLATDLYNDFTGWKTARLEANQTPMDAIEAAAPYDFPKTRLDAVHMDMRHLDLEDSSLDFCYSSCAIEHIGQEEDFVSHLREVRRVLKPDGVYAFTTELLFHDESKAVARNYKFTPAYLQDLFSKAGLSAEPDFDCALARLPLNLPPVDDGFFPAQARSLNWSPKIILAKDGLAYTSGAFLLGKGKADQPMRTQSLEVTTRWLNTRLRETHAKAFADWTFIDPWGGMGKHKRTEIFGHEDFRSESDPAPFRATKEGLLARSSFLFAGPGHTEFRLKCRPERTMRLRLLIKTKAQMWPRTQSVVAESVVSADPGSAADFTIGCATQGDHVYALEVRLEGPGQTEVHDLAVLARHRGR